MRTFPLRILRSPPGTWGIAIDLTAQAIVGTPPAGAVAITGRVHLSLGSVAETVPDDAARFLASGLGRVAARIEDAVPGSELVTVVVHELRFAVTDFQVEGLAVAIMCWAGEEFGFVPPEPEVDFDRAANRYLFSFPDAREVRTADDGFGYRARRVPGGEHCSQAQRHPRMAGRADRGIHPP